MSSHHHQHEYHHDHHHHQEEHQHQQHQEEGNNVFTFPSNGSNNGFERLTQQHEQQIRRDNNNNNKMTTTTTLVGGHHEDDPSSAVAFETSGMLSEMFNFGAGAATAASEILDYRRTIGPVVGPDWYGSAPARQLARDNTTLGDHHPEPTPPQHHHQIPTINTDSAAAMQLFLANPQPRSPSPPPPPTGANSTLHMLGGFHPAMGAAPTPSNPNFWGAAPAELGGIIEGQGLSLSLSSSLQQLEAAKQAQEFRNIAAAGGSGDHSPHSLFFNQNQTVVGANSSSTSNSSPRHFIKQLAGSPQQPILQSLQGGVGAFGVSPGPNTSIQHQVQLGFGTTVSTGSSLGVVNVLRSSKYAKPAQELLEEFCSVGRGQIKKAKLTRQNSSNPNQSSSTEGGGGDGGSSSTKDPPPPPPPPPMSPADRIEHQRRKVKLLSMLDEVDRRYNHYCEQMQMVVNSFDMVMGYGAAMPYTALAQKAMSRHFRCLKEAIQAQLKQSCEVLGEKDPSTSSGITKGETPRLKMLEQSLRQQRAFHQLGMMDQEAWRPQRGLPERSVNILRAWLFEHFLHPYPSDADKHLLARQTGLSRNQVSNWFINARVRLWKPMIEEMYQQESKEAQQEAEAEDQDDEIKDIDQTTSTSNNNSNTVNNTNNDNLITTTQQQQQQQQQQQGGGGGGAQNPMPWPSSSASASASVSAVGHNHNNNNATDAKRSAETMTRQGPPHQDHGHHYYHHQPPLTQPSATALTQANNQPFYDDVGPATIISFGTTNPTGDVSLTLGLRHAGNNAPDKTTAAFSLGDFGSC